MEDLETNRKSAFLGMGESPCLFFLIKKIKKYKKVLDIRGGVCYTCLVSRK